MLVAPCSSSATTTSAASASRARRVRRTATDRVSGGAPSRMTSPNAPLRSNTSAHQAPAVGVFGRTIVMPGDDAALTCAQSRGASVRRASMYATRTACFSVCSTSVRRSVVFPLPRAPRSSVSRPRGSPRAGSAASSASIPVATPARSGAVGRSTSASCCLSVASDVDMT